MSQITLYSIADVDRSGKVRWTAAELDLEVIEERQRQGAHRRPPYTSINPYGHVPSVLFDGEEMLESTAICQRLAEAFETPKLWVGRGESERGSYLYWLAVFGETMEARLVECAVSRAGILGPEYFDLHDGQDVYEQYVHFLMGLAPSALHSGYMDISKADPAKGRGPSSIIGTQLAACVAGAEAVRILLGRGPSQLAPCYLQFDAYRRKIRSKRLRGGNRNWLQRLKKLVVMRLMKRHGLDVAFRSLRPA